MFGRDRLTVFVLFVVFIVVVMFVAFPVYSPLPGVDGRPGTTSIYCGSVVGDAWNEFSNVVPNDDPLRCDPTLERRGTLILRIAIAGLAVGFLDLAFGCA